jgi:hypothetical protein
MVLCYLEGRTNEEAAHQLQWPIGTVKVRLMRGREMLRRRLTRRGLAVSSTALTTILCQDARSAAMPPALADTMIQAALLFGAGKFPEAGIVSAHTVALTEGVLKTMWWDKLRIMAGMLVAVGLLVGGAGWLTYRLVAEQGPVQNNTVPKANVKETKTDDKKNPTRKRPSELHIALAKAASETYQGYLEEMKAGKIFPEEVMCKWSVRWLEAQLALSNNKSDRIAAYNAHRDRMTVLEKVNKNHLDQGKIAPKHYWAVKYFLLEAEIWLARAKSGR